MFFSGDSEVSFSQSARNSIEEKFRLRCVICLNYTSTIQCFHIINAATPGKLQLRHAVELGILPSDYQRDAPENGMLLCPNCHAYFTQNCLVLSLPIPVLEYILDYVHRTPKASQKPLHEVFELLAEVSQGKTVDLPDTKAISPYLGLFTLLTLDPTRVVGNRISTQFFPPLFIIHDKKFVKANSNTSLTSDNVARIFDSLALADGSPLDLGTIPISPDDQAFKEERYWRIPAPLAPIFAALIERLHYDSSRCHDIRLAKSIYYILGFQSLDNILLEESNGNGGPSGGGGGGGGGGGPSGGSGPNDDNEGGGGPSRGGRASSKRRGGGVKTRTSPRKGVKKARKSSGSSKTRAQRGESGEFPPHAWFQNQQYDRWEVSLSTCIPDDAPAHLISTSSNVSGSENGLSVSAQSPHDEDNPAKWQFGPSFTTNKIIFTARAMILT